MNIEIQTRPYYRRPKRRTPIWLYVFEAWMILAGGASGILLAAIVINAIWPDHPVYLAIRGFLESTFGS